jgi:uncharacterized membrane protein
MIYSITGLIIIVTISLSLLYYMYKASDSLLVEHAPAFIYFFGLTMIILNVSVSHYIVGSDVHMEYYYASLARGYNVWPMSLPTPQGTSIVNSIIAAGLPAPLELVYKLVFPLMFAFVPVLLYKIFTAWIQPKQALLASFMFIAFTPFYMEVPTIARQMIAELVLVGGLYFILKSTWKWRYLVILGLGALIPLCHYSIAAVAVTILVIAIPIDLILKQKQWKGLSVLLLGILIASACYFPFVQEGAVVQKFGYLYNQFVPGFMELKGEMFKTSSPMLDNPAGQVLAVASNSTTPLSLADRYGTLIDLAFGGNFLKVDWVGKGFLIAQWIIMILIPIGLWKIRKNKAFWPVATGCIVSLGLCLVPGWANILNLTRYFHLVLIILAIPIAISLKPRIVSVIIIVYFLFASGFMFEITKQPNIETLTAPYSIGLSNYRMDLGASTTEDDIKVRDYIIDNNLFPIHSDVYGSYLIEERIGPQYPQGNVNLVIDKDTKKVTGFIFLRSRNVEDETFTVWTDIGMRSYRPYENYFPENGVGEVIYRSGSSFLIKITGE